MGEDEGGEEGNGRDATLEGGVLYARDPRAGSMTTPHDIRGLIAAGVHIMRAWRSGSGWEFRNRRVGRKLHMAGADDSKE